MSELREVNFAVAQAMIDRIKEQAAELDRLRAELVAAATRIEDLEGELAAARAGPIPEPASPPPEHPAV